MDSTQKAETQIHSPESEDIKRLFKEEIKSHIPPPVQTNENILFATFHSGVVAERSYYHHRSRRTEQMSYQPKDMTWEDFRGLYSRQFDNGYFYEAKYYSKRTNFTPTRSLRVIDNGDFTIYQQDFFDKGSDLALRKDSLHHAEITNGRQGEVDWLLEVPYRLRDVQLVLQYDYQGRAVSFHAFSFESDRQTSVDIRFPQNGQVDVIINSENKLINVGELASFEALGRRIDVENDEGRVALTIHDPNNASALDFQFDMPKVQKMETLIDYDGKEKQLFAWERELLPDALMRDPTQAPPAVDANWKQVDVPTMLGIRIKKGNPDPAKI